MINGARLGMAFNQACESMRSKGVSPTASMNKDKLKDATKYFYDVVGEIEKEMLQ